MGNVRLSLRAKMLLFTALIAALPLAVAGQSLVRIAQDELKSAANEQLVTTARQVTDEFNDFYEFALYSPLDLIRNSIDGQTLGVEEKVAVLRQGISDLPDVVALQVDLSGAAVPIVIAQQAFLKRLEEKFDEPLAQLRVEQPYDGQLASADQESSGSEGSGDGLRVSEISYIEETDDWLATSSLPLKKGISGRSGVVHARINLDRLRTVIREHQFAKTGSIHIVDMDRNIVFQSTDTEYANTPMLDAAIDMLESNSRSISVRPFTRPDGEISLGAISFPRPFPWAVLVEKPEKDAYLPVTLMIESLLLWLGLGLAAAVAGSIFFAHGISKPILAIGETAMRIAGGDLKTRVSGVRSRDEIGDLAKRFNDMIVQLNERFELQKFVSAGTMSAIQNSDDAGVKLGGERKVVAILFADIRGYTEFSESRDPEMVVDVLNHYFQDQSDIVAAHNGDIDKFVGDQIMAVFHGKEMAKDAVNCALDILKSTQELKHQIPDSGLEIGIGVDMGSVVVGAMGSRERMDYTVLGDHVNLAARLCSAAEPRQALISSDVFGDLPDDLQTLARELEPIRVKGKSKPIGIYGYES